MRDKLIICRTKDLAQEYKKAFDLGYEWRAISWGCGISGRIFEKIIFIEDPAYVKNLEETSPKEVFDRFISDRNFYLDNLKNRLRPTTDNEGIIYL